MNEFRRYSILQRILNAPVFWVMAATLIYRWAYHVFLLPDPIVHPDSPSYLDPSTWILPGLFFGKVDLIRTPLYPMFLAGIRFFFGENGLMDWTVFIQGAVSWASIYCFYRVAESLIRNRTIVVLAALYYGCFPTTLFFNTSIMSESLAVSLTVLLCYGMMKYLRRPNRLLGFVMGLIPFFLVMYRPAFLVLMPIFVLFWVARIVCARNIRLPEWFGLTGILLAIVLLLGYCRIVERQHGIFNLCSVQYMNQLHIIIQSGLYRHGSDAEMNRQIQANIDEYERSVPMHVPGPSWLYPTGISDGAYEYACWKNIDDYGPPSRMADYTRQTIRANWPEFIFYSLRKLFGLGEIKIGYVENHSAMPQTRFLIDKVLKYAFCSILKLDFLYILLVLEFMILCCSFPFRDESDWLWAIVWLWTTGSIVTMVVGGACDWGRLTFPLLPFFILLVARFAELFGGVHRDTARRL